MVITPAQIEGPLGRAFEGALAGLVATVPMTIVMFAVQRLLPARSQIPQEPQIITDEMLRRANMYDTLADRGRRLAAVANHFGYGASCGAACANLAGDHLRSSPGAGLAAGLLVWAAGYAGWLPAFNILPSPPERLPGRNALLVAGHAVWGLSLHVGLRAMERPAKLK